MMNSGHKEEHLRATELRKICHDQLTSILKPGLETRASDVVVHELHMLKVELEAQNEEMQRMHLALEQSRDRYRDLYEFSPVGYLTLSHEGRITEANFVAANLLGQSKNNLCSHPFARYLIQEHADRWHLHFKRALHSDIALSCELQVKRADASTITVILESLCRTPDGSPIMCVTLTDITARKQADEKLRVSDLALKAVSQGVLISGADGLIISVNDAFMAITGFDELEILGHTCLFVQGPLTDPNTVAEIRMALETHTYFAGEVLNYRKDGSVFWNDLSISPVLDTQGILTHFIGITRDITARKLIENEKMKLDQRLRDQQFYTRSLIETNIDALITTDHAGIITDVNKQMQLLTDCTRDELIGAPFMKFFTEPACAEAAINLVLSEKKVINYELTARTRDGRETVVSFNASTFYDRNRTLQGVFAAARDVTERKRLDCVLEDKNGEPESHRLVADKANLVFAIVDGVGGAPAHPARLLR